MDIRPRRDVADGMRHDMRRAGSPTDEARVSSLPKATVLVLLLRPCVREARLSACLFFPLPPMQASSIPTSPPAIASGVSPAAWQMRCNICHAVSCVTPISLNNRKPHMPLKWQLSSHTAANHLKNILIGLPANMVPV